MKRTLLCLTALILSSCTLVTRATGERGTIGAEGLTLVITNPGPDDVTGDPTRPGDGPALRVEGVNIRPTGEALTWCAAEATRWACSLPTLKAGASPTRVTFAAVNPASEAGFGLVAVSGYRASRGALPTVFWLR